VTPGARVQAAIELGEAISADSPVRGAPADALAQGYFRARRYIGAKDRAAIAAMVYGILRGRAQLDWWIARTGAGLVDSPRARAIAHLALNDRWQAEDFDAHFDGDRFRPAAPIPAERAMIRGLAGRSLAHPEQPLAVRHNVPDWIAPALVERFGDEAERELAAMAAPAQLDLRVNTLRGTREAALGALRKERIEARPTTVSPRGIRVAGRPPLSALEVFKRGSIEVQDEGSQIAALLVDARPGMRVCDFCAGAGGKTLALSAAMENQGHIVACDTSAKRLEGAKTRLRRAKAFNVEQRLLASERDQWVKRHKHAFDRVLVDAPCTGTGTWRRNPDAKWVLSPGDVVELAALQRRILDSAQRLVKPGGRLVYVTCSLLKDEDEAQAEWFAQAHPEFAALPVAAVWPATVGGEAPNGDPYLVLTPAQHGTDGFFVAVFERHADG
jgi:16S rRNA (cytosine967-C5)-methyltransferase